MDRPLLTPLQPLALWGGCVWTGPSLAPSLCFLSSWGAGPLGSKPGFALNIWPEGTCEPSSGALGGASCREGLGSPERTFSFHEWAAATSLFPPLGAEGIFLRAAVQLCLEKDFAQIHFAK